VAIRILLNLDRYEGEEEEVLQARYNHITWCPLHTVWQEARLAKIVIPMYYQLEIFSADAEKGIAPESEAGVYDDLWKHMCYGTNNV